MNKASLIGHTLELCQLVDSISKPSDKIVKVFFHKNKYLGSRDRRFIAEGVYKFVRNRRFAETLLQKFVDENNRSSDLNAKHFRYLPLYIISLFSTENQYNIGEILSFGSYWKTYFPNTDLEYFTQWVEKNKSLDFLRDDKIQYLGVRYSISEWLTYQLLKQYGEETEKLLIALNTPASTILRVNLLKTDRDNCQERLQSEGIQTVPTKYSPAGLVALNRFNSYASAAFKEGWYEIQDEGSQLISLLISPKHDDFIIDACAGAGGKTLHLADLIHDRGKILAVDVNEIKLESLTKRVARAGLKSITMRSEGEISPESLYEKADIVLVDAPCSGTGRLRRSPDAKLRITESKVNYCTALQQKILRANSKYVKREGKLIYATCSLLSEENEEIVDLFLAENNEFRLISSDEQIESLNLSCPSPYIKILPHRHGTDGFFIAIMKRKS